MTHSRRSLFQRELLADTFVSTIFRYRDAGKFQLHGFVVMPDHVHVLITPASDMSVERCVQLIKGGFSFAIRQEFRGEVWQNGYHAHRVMDAEDYKNQVRYIENNPNRRQMQPYPYVHTADGFRGRMEPAPLWTAEGMASPGG